MASLWDDYNNMDTRGASTVLGVDAIILWAGIFDPRFLIGVRLGPLGGTSIFEKPLAFAKAIRVLNNNWNSVPPNAKRDIVATLRKQLKLARVLFGIFRTVVALG